MSHANIGRTGSRRRRRRRRDRLSVFDRINTSHPVGEPQITGEEDTRAQHNSWDGEAARVLSHIDTEIISSRDLDAKLMTQPLKEPADFAKELLDFEPDEWEKEMQRWNMSLAAVNNTETKH